ncbi:MAG: type transport system permease protein [Chloroflexia bacterium]|jgi:ABC-type transport system involved in multi-copper enzyme maturation permease subunit|nr:type transport system permease protein [Chloroflexia bacterium]
MQINPVIVKELRGRMRGPRAAIVMTIYLVVLTGVTLLFYWMVSATSGFTNPQSSQVGKVIFYVLVIFQMIMVALLTPAFTAGSITSEREQKTFDLLMTTLLPARSVIFGKLGSALSYVVLLIIAIAPLESLAFMFGGVSPEEIVLSQVVMLMSALLFASAGIFWSSVLKSSVASNVLTYGTMLFQLIGIPVLYLIITSTAGSSRGLNQPPMTDTPEFWYTSGLVLSSHPLIAMIISELFISNGDPLFIYSSTQYLNGRELLVVSPWLLFCIEALIFSTIFVLISIRAVQPVHIKRQGKRSAPGHEPVPVGAYTADQQPPPSAPPLETTPTEAPFAARVEPPPQSQPPQA